MKKKKLLKRIEELERRNTQLEDKYKRVLFEDDKKAILMERFIYKQKEKQEQLLLKALSSGVNTFTPLTNPIYHPDPILFKKYCKECKLPMKQKAEMLEDRSGIRVKYCFDIRKL